MATDNRELRPWCLELMLGEPLQTSFSLIKTVAQCASQKLCTLHNQAFGDGRD